MMTDELRAAPTPYATSTGWVIKHLGSVLLRLADILWAWPGEARSRHALGGLSDHTLRDIGLTRVDLYRQWREAFRRE